MKRPLLSALIIGLIAGGIIMGLHLSGLLLHAALAVTDLLSRNGTATRLVGDKWQYPLVFALAIGVGWITLVSSRSLRFYAIMAALVIELVALAWICSLYHVFFQPLPSVAGVALALISAVGLTAVAQRRAARPPKTVVAATISRAQPAPMKVSDAAVDSTARAYEVTAVVCDIANKHDLTEGYDPAVFIEITEQFIAHVTEKLRAAGAYIESSGVEGVVAIFGFPTSDNQHAEKATRQAMALTHSFSEFVKSSNAESLKIGGIHAGVSSGMMVIAPSKSNGQRATLAIGEPVELARRFCIANRFYGSRVLLGPRTFELSSKILVARPIDFLSGVDVREQHEIYEPLTLALDASREQISRRDAFWNGVVLYREKRWAEAYTQFQNARGPNDQEDRPLQLYLRRLEPLVLQLTDTPAGRVRRSQL